MSALADVTPGNTANDQPPASAAPAADQPAGAIPADAQPGAAAIAPRPTIPVALLTARPGNVRQDLELSSDFLASIEANESLSRCGSPPALTAGDPGEQGVEGRRPGAQAVARHHHDE
jgi:hypothetical protein